MLQETDHLLNLRLADGDASSKKRKKRECSDLDLDLDFKRNFHSKLDSNGENNFGFLQIREEMIKFDPKKQGIEDGKGLYLVHLLLMSATAIDEKRLSSAGESLCKLYQNVSLRGDSIQRVAAYFADGLAAKLLTRKSPFFDMIMKEPSPEEEFAAFTELYRASPYHQFAHFTANQAIIEAFEEEEDHNNRTLHVIDFDISHGFQWPSLIQSLSDKATDNNPISLRITGIGKSSDELVETENRLANFARSCRNLVFEFHGLLTGFKPVSLRTRKNETVAVNLVFYLQTLSNPRQISETLKSIYLLNPSIVVLVEQEGNRNPKTFLSRFMESLHYFAAMFDSLDDCLPPESAERLSIEKNHLGKEIKRVINCEEEEENKQRYERLEKWKGLMEDAGFGGVELSSRCVSQAKLLLQIRTHGCGPMQLDGGFRVFQRDRGRALSLGWYDRHLITASAWQCLR